MHHTDAEEFARARLAYVSTGRPPLSAPRRALVEPEAPPEPPQPPPSDPASRESSSPQESPSPPLLRRMPSLTIKHLVVVAVLLLCGVGVAVAALGRSSATEVPIEPLAVQVEAPPPSPPPPEVKLRVHVAGAVAVPGVVTLPEGSIVQDAIASAGGLIDGADPAQLNLAAPLTDGMQIIIGTREEPRGDMVGAEPQRSVNGSGTGAQVNLNTASQSELESLPGVGPVMAQAILTWREQNGRFSAIEELQEISGIGPKTFQKLQLLVTV